MPRLVRILLILFAVIAALFLIVASIPIRIAPPDWDFPQDSVANAKRVGTFVCMVNLDPTQGLIKGQTGRFREAWIETKRITYNSLIYHSNQRVPGYFLCVTYDDNAHDHEIDFPFFVRDASGNLVTWSSRPATNNLGLELQLTETEFQHRFTELTVVSDYNVLKGEKVTVRW